MRLIELFDKDPPITNLSRRSREYARGYHTDIISFDVRDHRVVIEIESHPRGDHSVAKFAMDYIDVDIPEDARGYNVIFRVDNSTDVTGTGDEFAIFSAVLKLLNDYFRGVEWDYITFQGAGGSRNKLYQAIAQRMTRSQPGVERITNIHNDFVIAKF